jgi:hypothetical protein
VLQLLGVVGVLSREGLAEQRREEDDAEEERKPVLEREPPHSTVSPTAIQVTRPATMTSQ